MTIGQNIRSLRKKRGLTQEKLGALCGISGGTIGSYELGVTIPKKRTIEKLAQALDVSPDRIAGGTGSDVPTVLKREHAQESDGLLFNGILGFLKERFGRVEGKIIAGEDGHYIKYYVVEQLPDSFILYERDIHAIVRAAKASMMPLVQYMHKVYSQAGPAAN